MKRRNVWAVCLLICLLAGTVSGCSKEPVTPVARLGTETIDLSEAVFYTRMLQEQWEITYYQIYGEDMWQRKPEFGEGTGDTLGEALKETVMDTLTEIHLLCMHAKEYDAELTQAEKQALEKRAEAFMQDNTPAVLEAAGADKETVKQFLEYNEQAARTAAALQAACEPEIQENEARVGKLTYCLFATTGSFDAEGNQTPFTEEELAQIRKDADRFAERAGELGDITAAGEEISHTVIDVYYNDTTDGGAHELVAGAARELETGGVSGVIETQEGYYIVQRVSDYDEKASKERMEELKYLAREDFLAETIETWKTETPLEILPEVWDEVRVDEVLMEH